MSTQDRRKGKIAVNRLIAPLAVVALSGCMSSSAPEDTINVAQCDPETQECRIQCNAVVAPCLAEAARICPMGYNILAFAKRDAGTTNTTETGRRRSYNTRMSIICDDVILEESDVIVVDEVVLLEENDVLLEDDDIILEDDALLAEDDGILEEEFVAEETITEIPCTLGSDNVQQACAAVIVRGDPGYATFTITRPDGSEQILEFSPDDVVVSVGEGRVAWDRDVDSWWIAREGLEQYFVSDADIYGYHHTAFSP